MPALDATLQKKLTQLESVAQKRSLWTTGRDGVQATKHGKNLISFSCNDYLGLSRHPAVIKAAKDALQLYGAGAGASRLITGNNPLYDDLESALVRYKQTETACVFGSGYLAKLGVIPALVGEGDLIIADKFSHACMLDGAKLSGAKVVRFAHNDVDHCKNVLKKHRKEYGACLIMTETVFSMDGDIAPLTELQALADEFDCWLLTDDAHGLGIVKETNISPDRIQMGTLSKAVGSYGGYVCGSSILIDYIKTSARSLIYSTALPPATLAASNAALQIIEQEPERGKQALRNAQHFTTLLGMPEAQSAIVPVLIGKSEDALELSAYLEENGYLVSAIRPPTVPQNSARLRFTFSALHTQEQIRAVVALLKERGVRCVS